jgi:class 3 adenylate cyclase
MGLLTDISEEVEEIFKTVWAEVDGRVVPVPTDLGLGNEARHFAEATVLYADLSGSTALVDSNAWFFAAEIYKAFILSAARVIKSEGGEITAYDGDRVMAVFLGDNMCDAAARVALKINYCRVKVVDPLLAERYPKSTFRPRHVVGIDCSELRAARIGVRKANDLVWVGRAANYAAKLTELPAKFSSRITKDVYNRLSADVRLSGGQTMWESAKWTDMQDFAIYRSTWMWPVRD